MPKPVNQVMFRTDVLKRIESRLAQVKQWTRHERWDYAFEYASEAKALIELLEIDDCGSTGGFDTERGQDKSAYQTLESRYQWLLSVSER